MKGGLDEINDKLFDTLKANYAVWPLSLIINFYYIPLRFRVLWDSSVGLLYNILVSYIAFN